MIKNQDTCVSFCDNLPSAHILAHQNPIHRCQNAVQNGDMQLLESYLSGQKDVRASRSTGQVYGHACVCVTPGKIYTLPGYVRVCEKERKGERKPACGCADMCLSVPPGC